MSNLVARAARFAQECHKGQERKYNGRPYITHPMRVAATMSTHPIATDALIAAAWLHDVSEDCGVKIAELREMFGDAVANPVYWMTNPSKGSPLPRSERKKMDREHLKAAPKEVKILKMIDRYDNLVELSDAPDDFVKLYCGETLLLLEVIEDADQELAAKIRSYRQFMSKL
jgi:(p)ppGpp synthase/HD superfamily hydrolase